MRIQAQHKRHTWYFARQLTGVDLRDRLQSEKVGLNNQRSLHKKFTDWRQGSLKWHTQPHTPVPKAQEAPGEYERTSEHASQHSVLVAKERISIPEAIQSRMRFKDTV
jgi:hypothetical protein